MLSLALITKNAGSHIKRTINSVFPFVDEVIVIDNGSKDKTIRLARGFNAKVIQIDPKRNPEYFCEINGNVEPNFAMLRRRSFQECKGDWILWLDADDVMDRPDLLEGWIKQAEMVGANALVMDYHYEVDQHGVVQQAHRKERVIKRGTWEWERDPDWAVHENLYDVDGSKPLYVDDIVVVHEKEDKDRAKSNMRNFNILMWMLQKDKFKKDPRVYFLLGRELLSLKRFDKAIKAFNKYLEMEFATHDALDACIYTSEIYEATGSFDEALSYALRGIQIRPEHPLGYIYAARYFNYLGKYEEALSFLEVSSKKQLGIDASLRQDYKQNYLYTKGLCDAKEGLKEFEESKGIALQAMEQMSPNEKKEFEDVVKRCNEGLSDKEIMQSLDTLIQTRLGKLKQENRKPTVGDFKDIFETLGGDIYRTRLYAKLRRFTGDFRVHGEKEISIVHVSNFEEWSPESIVKNGGGGSETACVELSTWFQKMGYEVTVYARPPKAMEYEGVKWRNVREINYADNFNIFISLRSLHLFKEHDIHAKKRFLWLQDVMFPHEYTQDIVDKLDKIIVLSNYHRITAPNVRESKFYYTTNGINLKLIEEIEKENIERIKNKCVYISSADRGLTNLVDIWADVKKAVPDATAYDFYGWNSWDAFAKMNPEATGMKERLIEGMKKTGIVEGGRIGKRELYRQLFSADYHTYPLIGPAETSCIAVMESQACGAIPVTTGITALEETQQYGIKVDLDNYKDTLIKTMQEPIEDTEEYRKKMMAWAREKFNWENVAKQWVNDLFIK